MNLIPLNPTGAFAGRPPDRERINRFAARLAAAGVTVTVRRNRGIDIDAACGQLRARESSNARRGEQARSRRTGAGSARMSPVNERRFVNRSQPQTLYMAVILCYVELVFNLLGGLPGLILDRLRARGGRLRDRQRAEVGLRARDVVRRCSRSCCSSSYFGSATITALGPLIDLIFYGALVGLLVHPMSRDYQRIWFR